MRTPPLPDAEPETLASFLLTLKKAERPHGGPFYYASPNADLLGVIIERVTGARFADLASELLWKPMGARGEADITVDAIGTPRTGELGYDQLLDHFWHSIDPTTKDRQFCDVGSPYRTAIFAHGRTQLEAALASRSKLEKSKPFAAPIVTEIVEAGAFYPAEAYHQDYYLKNPLRYRYYRFSCGRDARLAELWGDRAGQ